MLWTSGWLSLKSTSSLAVKRPKIPRKIVSTREGTIPYRQYVRMSFIVLGDSPQINTPTAAIALGKDNIPLLTISAIMRKATNCI